MERVTKQQKIFGGINLVRELGGPQVLLGAGVNTMHPLECEGEDSLHEGWKGTSWGFVYTQQKVMLARGMPNTSGVCTGLH